MQGERLSNASVLEVARHIAFARNSAPRPLMRRFQRRVQAGRQALLLSADRHRLGLTLPSARVRRLNRPAKASRSRRSSSFSRSAAYRRRSDPTTVRPSPARTAVQPLSGGSRLGIAIERIKPEIPNKTGVSSACISRSRKRPPAPTLSPTCSGRALEKMARETGLEPATSGVTGRRSNQLSYSPAGRRPDKPDLFPSQGSQVIANRKPGPTYAAAHGRSSELTCRQRPPPHFVSRQNVHGIGGQRFCPFYQRRVHAHSPCVPPQHCDHRWIGETALRM